MKLHCGSFDHCDLPTLQEAGYWFSDFTGNWYKKLYKPYSVIKGVYVYGWELITDKGDIELLNGGLDPRLFDEPEFEHEV
jgi:hypothetical protein